MTILKSKQSILIVEDDEQLRLLVQESLSAAGYDVTAVGSIGSAREAVSKRSLDLLIVDMRLPDGNGLDLAQSIRRESGTAIIAVTGAGDEVDRILGLELGADDFVQKPFFNRELVARVKAVMRRYNASQELSAGQVAENRDDALEFHDYVISFGSRNVRHQSGGQVRLTTSEFDVLAHLVKNRNQVQSREEIYSAARLRSGDPGRLIDGLVSRLRQKLFDEQSAKQKIRTIHGRGYVMTSDT